jgi:hypothetical protein
MGTFSLISVEKRGKRCLERVAGRKFGEDEIGGRLRESGNSRAGKTTENNVFEESRKIIAIILRLFVLGANRRIKNER